MTILEGKTWRFEQLAGAERILVLSGWAAPLGGPRVEAVVRTPTRIRTERVYYPGSDTPTRHVFGKAYPNWELKGRFRDRARPPMGGPGFAKAKSEEVESFVGDQQPVRISWGDVLVAQRAFLVEFDPGWEAEGEVEWVLRIEIDQKELVNNPAATLQTARPPADYENQIRAALATVETRISLFDLPGAALDALDTILANIDRAVFQAEIAIAGVGAFRSAPTTALNRILTTQESVRAVTVQLRETVVAIPQDALIFQDNADAAIKFLTAQAAIDRLLLEALIDSVDMTRAAELAKAGRAQGSHVARTGDTWESISTLFFGRPDRAGDIRELNAIAPGAQPVPGVEYLIPK